MSYQSSRLSAAFFKRGSENKGLPLQFGVSNPDVSPWLEAGLGLGESHAASPLLERDLGVWALPRGLEKASGHWREV